VLGAAGIVAAGVAGYFYYSGFSKDRELRRNCAPKCSSSDADIVRSRFRVGDVALGIAVISFGGALYFGFSSTPSSEPADARSYTLGVAGRW
jgi:hypothetical protein